MTQASSIMLGRGEIRIADSQTYEGNGDPALTSSHSAGQAEECALNNELEFKTKRPVNNLSAVKSILTKNELYLQIILMEATQKNLNMLLTGNRNSGDFFVGGNDFAVEHRVEVRFVYPDGVSTLTLVLPKCKIVETSDLNLVSLSEPSKPAFTFQSFPIDNATWNKKLGKAVFS
jgi:hypothetical protein